MRPSNTRFNVLPLAGKAGAQQPPVGAHVWALRVDAMHGLFATLRGWLVGDQADHEKTPRPPHGAGTLTPRAVLPTLDLHGLGVKEAIEQVGEFLRLSQQARVTRVRIVYGKGKHSRGGRGVLREAVPNWLETDGATYIARWERRLDMSGSDGGAEVILKLPPAPETMSPDD